MSQNSVKLVITDILNYEQAIGPKGVEYAMVSTLTEDNKVVMVAVSHNSLRKKGITSMMFESIVGCTLVVQNDVNSETGEITATAGDKVQQVLDGVKDRSFVFCNASNHSLIKSERFNNDQADMRNSVQAKLLIEQDKERKAVQARLQADKLKFKAMLGLLNESPATTARASKPAAEAVLES